MMFLLAGVGLYAAHLFVEAVIISFFWITLIKPSLAWLGWLAVA